MKTFIQTVLTILVLTSGLGIKAQDMKTQEQVIKVVSNIFSGTDQQNWSIVEESFSSRVLLDYTSMAGGKPTSLSPQEITGSWSSLLPGFDKTRHMIHHFKVTQNGTGVTLKHDGTANHYLNGNIWTVVGNYEHRLIKEGTQWKVCAMTFNLEFIDGDIDLPRLAKERLEGNTLTNVDVVDRFFVALETQNLQILNEVFAEDGKQMNPFIPEGFPKSFDGRDAIYKQYTSLTESFGDMKFPRQIIATEDPNTVFVKFKGQIQIKAGGSYENDYLGIFKLQNGLIKEYTEYFNPIIMAEAFNIDLK